MFTMPDASMRNFVEKLRSKNEDVRIKGARDLYNYVTTELREVGNEELNRFMDSFNHQIFELVSSHEAWEKKGGILAIECLITVDVGNQATRLGRYTSYLRNLLPSNDHNDVGVMHMAAKAVGRLSLVSGTYEFGEYEMRRALEGLTADRNEWKRHAAVLVITELSLTIPTFFYQQFKQFFSCIFYAVRDPSPTIRNGAVSALRQALVITAQRETKESQKPEWYQQCLDEAFLGFHEVVTKEKGISRDDRIHGSLLVLNELFRVSNLDFESSKAHLDTFPGRQPTGGQKKEQNSVGKWMHYSIGSSKHRSRQLTVTYPLHVPLTETISSYRPFVGRSGTVLAQRSYYGAVECGRRAPPLLVNEETMPSTRRPVSHESVECRLLLTQNFDLISDMVLKQKSSKNVHIQATLLALLPRLAAFKRARFVSMYLQDAVTHLRACLKREKERFAAFNAIGLIAVAVKEDINPHLPNILEDIRSALPSKESPLKKRYAVDSSVFTCISLLARAVHVTIAPDIKEILEPMLAVGLNPSLTASLQEIVTNIPPLKREVAESLLKVLSFTLCLKPKAFGISGSLVQTEQSLSAVSSTLSQNLAQRSASPCPTPQSGQLTSGLSEQDVSSVVLALRTLGSFDFEGHSLLQFARHCADQFLFCDQKSVRLEAVHTCSRMLLPVLPNASPGNTTMAVVSDVLSKLLVVGVTDAESEIRLCVIESLEEPFDQHLAQAENLNMLFMLLNDENFDVRFATVAVVGRLSERNPAYIMPTLRKCLMQLLTDMEFSGMGRNREQSAELLGCLVSNACTLVEPYMDPILKVLISRVKEKDPSPQVVIQVLWAIGELAQVSGPEMSVWLEDLMPILLELMQDSSSVQKRALALWSFGQVIESTGYVIKPYQTYPTLLDLLFSLLKTEQNASIRREVLRVLGILGALDPYKHKQSRGEIDDLRIASAYTDEKTDKEETVGEMLVNMNISAASLDEFYPSVTITMLLRILKDPTLSPQHNLVVKALTFVFNSLGPKYVPFVQQVIPCFLNCIKDGDPSFREFLVKNLGEIIGMVRLHIRPFLNEIFDLIKDFWTLNSPIQGTLILLVENVAAALGSEFKAYMSRLVPQILRVLMHDPSKQRSVTGKLLLALQKFGGHLDDCVHMVLPPLVKLFDSPEVPGPIRRLALVTLEKLMDHLDFTEFASKLIHPLVRTLEKSPELRPEAMNAICALVSQLGKQYEVFIPLVHRILREQRIHHETYDCLLSKFFPAKGGVLATDIHDVLLSRPKPSSFKAQETAQDSGAAPFKNKLSITPANILNAWEASSRVSKDDWLEWLRRGGIELLKSSPSPSLRSCSSIAQNYSHLLKDLFNAAFVSVWAELGPEHQTALAKNLETALNVAQDITEITQTILNLAEFMDHCDKGPLPLDPQLLGRRAMECRAYAKALRYKEDEFLKNGPSTEVVGALISINNKLQQKEAASVDVLCRNKHFLLPLYLYLTLYFLGLLGYTMKNMNQDLTIEEAWYEKLHNWEAARKAYERKLENKPGDKTLTLGQMRCLQALGEWDKLHDIASKEWDSAPLDMKENMATMAAAAAWGLNKWNEVTNYTHLIPRDTQEGCFFRAVLAIHHGDHLTAQPLIASARDLLEVELTTMAGESYERAYGPMINGQMLAELEEVITYKVVPRKRDALRRMWWDRLQGCQKTVDYWQKILQVRSLVLSPQENQEAWLKFASLCRKANRLSLSQKTLTMLTSPAIPTGLEISGGGDSVPPGPIIPSKENHKVLFALTKHLWDAGFKDEAFKKLSKLVQSSLTPWAAQMQAEDSQIEVIAGKTRPGKVTEASRLLARCFLKLGRWYEASQLAKSAHMTPDGASNQQRTITPIIQYYAAATKHDPTCEQSSVNNFEEDLGSKDASVKVPPNFSANVGKESPAYITQFTVPAVKGFIRSIGLASGSSLQDTLRLLTLWFDFGNYPEVYEALKTGVQTIDLDTWLQVIPQLIARIDTQRMLVAKLIHQLLREIGQLHPQALIYPLTVASKSSSVARSEPANKILKSMREHSQNLVNQAMMVSDELIRVAILWHELWHEGLEEASRLYFGDRNIEGMFQTLEPLHAKMRRGPHTLKETSFTQAYGRDLQDAHDWCKRYRETCNVRELNHAWDLYYHVFRKITRQLPHLSSLELQYVSPKLLQAKDLVLAVPGTYVPHQPIISIASVQSNLQVLMSKQRPRRIVIKGSNGADYTFLLKGHEDLRQDERVMQLFGLVNTLLMQDPETFRRNLTIQRYAVIPLSTDSGLIGWVPDCDTLHALIKDYRDKKKVMLNIEHRIMLRMAADYEHLTLMQKVEVFEHALEHTAGDDLAKLLWLKSPSSEIWFDRRTNYTRSLAVMSMVGYILGLGDRHPSNLMLSRTSGKVLHIDFGDCFEVAMTRDKFPEKIPFRLTRMLINAMEVTGIEGTYRMTCQSVMNVLRKNKDSVMAVLEAFVHDPLLNWRLVENNRGGIGTMPAGATLLPGKTAGQKTNKDMSPEDEAEDFLGLKDGPLFSCQRTLPKNEVDDPAETLNKKAVAIVNRVKDKLTGKDFNPEERLTVEKQVDLLIRQATSHENLCQCYIGWCPFW
ncbi:unnamed protein product [Notodromas monacha]|uniref:Serine/threonine-protein kinase TOR n=1 Tax=Notodromas monacha TaxID=399045 RepID=A0A7R9BLT8_9CRUS|nr:unnamed protein product [Notodromas monacha]CAG0917860.1 unnamed protein product [Notodromas monacha]